MFMRGLIIKKRALQRIFPPFNYKRQTNKPTDQPTDRPSDGQSRAFGHAIIHCAYLNLFLCLCSLNVCTVCFDHLSILSYNTLF